LFGVVHLNVVHCDVTVKVLSLPLQCSSQ